MKWLCILKSNSSHSLTRTFKINAACWKSSIDKSRYPVLNEDDLVENFIKGHGPGGQAVNKTSNCVFLKHLPSGNKSEVRNMIKLIVRSSSMNLLRYKSKLRNIDFSKFPNLDEHELSEHFIRGHGPGGSAVNKTSNCVWLKHVPSGIFVKCHESRLLQDNRKLAREMLRAKLDDAINGEMSVSAQQKRIDDEKYISQKRRAEKLRLLKQSFKEREGID